MRHLKDHRKLSKSSGPRRALLRNLATSFFLKSRIETTEEKAKEAQRVVEELITKAKSKDLSTQREVFAFLLSKEAGQRLYSTILPKVGERPGGYTRIVKTGKRRGDGASLAILELVE
ncbi:MAG: 50S ribosomal protein L17 [Caldiserica bacterium]|jgi:large subunit ribosomal protein L17|nr:50S ribosomal protein L17 [Caldisericota bacterium]MDH7563150.1 50S ribosomal protein L17 [Caldisericota bacterium]